MTEVMLDYDATPPRDLLARLARVAWYLGRPRPGVVQVARTRRGWHVRAWYRGPAWPPVVIVAVQAILGSDPERELFNLVRALALDGAPAFWRTRWNVLYRAKSKEGRI
jgi:hypothetical protein